MKMVSPFNQDEKYNHVKRSFCFYLDLQDKALSRTLSRRIEALGLQQDVFLTERVSHIIRDTPQPKPQVATARWVPRDGGRSRADAMLQRVQPDTEQRQPLHTQKNYITLTVSKAVVLLDKIYETFFGSAHRANVRVFKRHFIKIEFLDKPCRPLCKEFDFWPEIPLEPDPCKGKKLKEKKKDLNQSQTIQKMTRKNRPRIKEKEDKEQKGGFCEICNTPYSDASFHRRSPHHLAFVRDHTNFISLDTLIDAGADVTSFLDKANAINGERRSLRNMCNGDTEPKRRSKRSQSPDSTVNGDVSPKRNGVEDDRKHNTRCSKRISDSTASEDRQYYKVVGVSTKLRSSGGFNSAKKKEPHCNGTKPLVVKFRKIRKSELSVLSDEAEQFMFPKRASSTSSGSSDDEGKVKKSEVLPAPALERRRVARPLALKEESSEDDSWPEDRSRRKRRPPPVVRRTRRVLSKALPIEEPPPPEVALEPEPQTPQEDVSPLREEAEKCMKWEDGRLKYTPAVEQLEFAFESVPHSEPWFETFKRQDEDKIVTKNVPRYFSLYSTKTPKLPYEIGQLPPLKPNCCPLSDLVKRDEKPGPSRSYGTRGMKKQKFRKRQTAAQALITAEGHPRKSPREHASTLAILGSAGLLHRRKNGDDSKSTASEDTVSETQSNPKLEPNISETQEASERLQQFFSEVFEDAGEYDLPDEALEAETVVTTSTNAPDVLSLMSECEGCDIIKDEIREGAAAATRPKARRGKFKKKNRTGWPIKKKPKKGDSGSNSPEHKTESSLDRSSAEPPDDDATNYSASDNEDTIVEVDRDEALAELSNEENGKESQGEVNVEATLTAEEAEDSDDKPLKPEQPATAELEMEVSETKRTSRSSISENEDKEDKSRPKRKRSGPVVGDWLQPVVRVARVDPGAARKLRSAGRGRSARFR